MKKIGFLFPGQGAQCVGMGADFYLQSAEAKKIFDRANEYLGIPISKLCFEGPEEELIKTANTQITIFVTSLAILETIRARFPQLKPATCFGLSLGEFTALVALGSISFEDGLRLVRKRGELMEKAAQNHPGTMASIIGLNADLVEKLSKEAGCVAANFNSPDQTVISGSVETVSKACELASANGAKRAMMLKVGGAFHSPLMKDAEIGLQEALKATNIKCPEASFIPNVTAEFINEPEQIRTLLAEQLTNPVRWVKSIQTAEQSGITEFIEIGPGKVLKGLARKINSALTVHSVEKIDNLENLKTIFEEVSNAS